MILEEVLNTLVHYTIISLEYVGVLIIIWGGLHAIWQLIRHHLDFSSHAVKLDLTQTLSLALNFFLCAEVLKTFLASSIMDLMFVAALIVIRIIITFVVIYEIKLDRMEEAFHDTSAAGSHKHQSN